MTPDITRHDTEANLARDSGVCADTRPSRKEERDKALTKLAQLAQEWGFYDVPQAERQRQAEQARAERIQFCEHCGHRVPFGCEHVGETT